MLDRLRTTSWFASWHSWDYMSKGLKSFKMDDKKLWVFTYGYFKGSVARVHFAAGTEIILEFLLCKKMV